MSNYLYFLINTENGKKFVGKSSLPKWCLKFLLFDSLDEGNHYNKLLQNDWKKTVFEVIFEDCENCGEECDKIINEEELLNPING